MDVEKIVLAAIARETDPGKKFAIACKHGFAEQAIEMLLAMKPEDMKLEYSSRHSVWFSRARNPIQDRLVSKTMLMVTTMPECEWIDIEMMFDGRHHEEMVQFVHRIVEHRMDVEVDTADLKILLLVCHRLLRGTPIHRRVALQALRCWLDGAISQDGSMSFLANMPILASRSSMGHLPELWLVSVKTYLLEIGVEQKTIDGLVLRLFSGGLVGDAGIALALMGIYGGDTKDPLDAFMEAARYSAAHILRNQISRVNGDDEIYTNHFKKLITLGVFSLEHLYDPNDRRAKYDEVCISLLAEGKAGAVFGHLALFSGQLWCSAGGAQYTFGRLAREAYFKAVERGSHGIAFALAQEVDHDPIPEDAVHEQYELALVNGQKRSLHWTTIVIPPRDR